MDVLIDACHPGHGNPVMLAGLVLRQFDGVVGVDVIDGGELAAIGADDRHVLLDLAGVNKRLLHEE